eukprot:89745_1
MATAQNGIAEKVVCGYMRTIHNLIPCDIIHIIFKYYFVSKDSFKKYNPYYFNVINDRIVQRLSGSGWANVYGEQIIISTSKQFVKWTIKVNKLYPHNGCFGVTMFNDDLNKTFLSLDKISYGLWACTGGTMSHGSWKGGYGSGIAQGDVITIILDLFCQHISFEKNGKSLGIAFKNILIGKDINYRLVIGLINDNSEISLEQFDIRQKKYK